MRTMAGFVIFSILVACSLHPVFAIDCSRAVLEELINCNDCIRCGGFWCSKPGKSGLHCATVREDSWCPGQEESEVVPEYAAADKAGAVISPAVYGFTTRVGQRHVHEFTYAYSDAAKPKVHLTLVNTTQTNLYELQVQTTECKKGKCTTTVAMSPKPNFCLANGTQYEFANVRLHVDNVAEDAAITSHVPCACACSDKVERDSSICNGRGDFSCGVCHCQRGWSGKFCEKSDKSKCDKGRGDLHQCTNPYKDEVECSGNGYCGPCDSCICYKDREGSQYFDEENYCADLCLTISSECEPCLHNLPPGACSDCPDLTIREYNKTVMAELDEFDRKVWVTCPPENIDGCNYEYVAMRDSEGQTFVMMTNTCNGITGAVAGGNVNIMLPTVLGIIAVLAAATAVAGYMVWKGRQAPMPLAASQYQELDPEGSAGINPLYKSPTSSYNNPMWKGAKV